MIRRPTRTRSPKRPERIPLARASARLQGAQAGIGGAIAAGAVAGSAAGPIGTAVGAAVGAVAGGLVGKGIAERVNPTAEHAYWRQNYKSRPYANTAKSYDELAPAYQYGWESRVRYSGKRFDDIDSSLQNEWQNARGACPLNWEQARPAARDAWDRIDSGSK